MSIGMTRRAALAIAVAVAAAAPSMAAGQVVRDGSLGAGPKTFTGPSIEITPRHGRQVGANLFHSFSRFDLAKGDVATFTGPPSVSNVLTRVTGGIASNIDGTIGCSIAGANFYFINPAGVVFGPNAKLDVQGSFAAGTADVITLGGGGTFHADPAAGGVLTSDPPAAFGFLGSAAPVAVVSDRATLAPSAGRTLLLAGGEVRIIGGQLKAPEQFPAADVRIVGAGPGAEVPVQPEGDVTAVVSRGDVEISGGATVSSGLRTVIVGRDVAISAATVTGSTEAGDSAGTARIDASGVLSVTAGGSVEAGFFSEDVMSLRGREVRLEEEARISGGAGGVTIAADEIFSITGSSVGATGGPSGGSGDIVVTAPLVVMAGTSRAPAVISGAAGFGSFPVFITTDRLEGSGTVEISSFSFDEEGSSPGSVTLTSGSITLDGQPAVLQLDDLNDGRLLPIRQNVALDGTLGRQTALDGPTYSIDAADGRLVGGRNLFFSFERFNLADREVALFTGPPGVENVLARVSGPEPSLIDGKLRCTIDGADLLLMNPSGVVFGPGATLDVGGSFAVTTADAVGFSDRTRFGLPGAADATLGAGDVVSFGFLSPRPAGVQIFGSQLIVPSEAGLSVVAGPVRINGGLLFSAGALNIVGLDGAGSDVRFDPTSRSPQIDASRAVAFADVEVTTNAELAAPVGTVHGRDVRIEDSDLSTFRELEDLPDAESRTNLRASRQLAIVRGDINANPVSSDRFSFTLRAPEIILQGPIAIRGSSSQEDPALFIQAEHFAAFSNIRLDVFTFGPSNAFDLAVGRFTLDGNPAGVRFNTTNSQYTFAPLEQVNIATDGTLGPATALAGPDYLIGADLGRQVGPNLFHSFARFDVTVGEEVRFTGPEGVRRIIARVTGGGSSSIRGEISSDLAGTDFFFVNPAGVVTGPEAELRWPGSLFMTTATSLRMADGGRFDAVMPMASSLTGGTPVGFAFSERPASMNIQGEVFATPEAGNAFISLVGGDITIDAGVEPSFFAGDRAISVVSAGGAGEVVLDPDNPATLPDVSGLSLRGSLTLTADDPNSRLSSSGPLSIFARDVTNTGARLQGRPLLIDASETIALTGGGSGEDVFGTEARLRADRVVLRDVQFRTPTHVEANAIDGFGSVRFVVPSADDVVLQAPRVAHESLPASLVFEDLFETTFTLRSFGAVVMDGTLGEPASLAGPDFLIPASLGRQLNENLFHSFDTFHLAAGESATFQGPDTVRNVVARVTGAESSSISGSVRSTIPDANLFLINPAGIVFGRNGSLDVSGSVTLTTASRLGFSDGGTLPTVPGAEPLMLTGGLPVQYQFGPDAVGRIDVEASLSTSGQVLSLIGADVRVTAPVFADQRLNILAVGASGGLTLDTTAADASLELSALRLEGALELSVAFQSAEQMILGGGTVRMTEGQMTNFRSLAIRAGHLQLDDARVVSSSPGAELEVFAGSADLIGLSNLRVSGGGSVSVFVDGLLRLDNRGPEPFRINTDVGPGIRADADPDVVTTVRDGQVEVRAGSLEILGPTRISARSPGATSGDVVTITVAGDARLDGDGATRSDPVLGVVSGVTGREINFTAGSLSIAGGALIDGSSVDAGAGGDVRIEVSEQLTLDGTSTLPFPGFTGITARSGFGGGEGGRVSIAAGAMMVGGAAEVSGSTLFSGTGGNVTIDVRGPFTLDGGGRATSEAVSDLVDGAGGAVSVHAGTLMLANGGEISASSLGRGGGGNIDLRVDGAMSVGGGLVPARVAAESRSRGAGGSITVGADTLAVRDGGSISAATFGTGQAGSVQVQAGQVALTGGASIATSTAPGSSGAGNAVTIGTADAPVGNVTISGGSSISASTAGTGAAGDVSVFAAGDVAIDGAAAAAGVLTGVQAQAGPATAQKGGAVTIRAGRLLVSGGGQVVSNTQGAGAGGNVTVNADSVVLSDAGSSVAASADPRAAGDAGSVRLETAGAVNIAAGSEVAVSAPGGAGGDVTIDSAGPVRISGAAVTANARAAGGIVIEGSEISVGGGARLSTDTVENRPERTSDVTVRARAGAVRIDGGAVSAESTGTGTGGSVLVDAPAGDVLLGPGTVLSAKATEANAGRVTVRARDSVRADHATVSAEATEGSGGNIKLDASDTIHLRGSEITARAEGSEGAQISIDPRFVILESSTINGRAAGADVPVEIVADVFLSSPDSTIESDAVTAPVEVDVASALARLSGALAGAQARLEQLCGVRFGGQVSSFLRGGRGGLPPEPAGWTPSSADGQR